MKYFLFITLCVALAGCRKDKCASITDVSGETCCTRCFRTEEKMQEWVLENSGKPCPDIDCN